MSDLKEIPWPTDQAVVLLDEEYGYRSWVWWTGMTNDALAAWWKALDSVQPHFFDPRTLPGTLTPQYGLCREQPCIGTWNPDTIQYDEEDEPLGEEILLTRPQVVWVGHIHEDDDSCLHHEEFGVIRHQGYFRDSIEEE